MRVSTFFKEFKKIVIIFIISTIKNVKTILGGGTGVCRFDPSCTKYSQQCLEFLPLYQSIPKIIIRLFKCNPLFKGGYDPLIHNGKVIK